MAGRWALLIGIDHYPKLASNWQLGGCVNDVQIMKDALVRRFGFGEEEISTLLNEQATRDGILAALDALVERAGQDDVVVFHYSGHGSQRPDGPERDEPDGWDETLVPHDSGRVPCPNRDITDDEIYVWLQRLTARTPYVTLIFDCCHSGTAVRERKVRTLPRDRRDFDKLGAPPTGDLTALEGARNHGPSGWLPLGEKYVLFAASGSLECANEILTGEPQQIPHGALTYYLVQELMSADFKSGTCAEIFERVAPRLRGRCEQQHPQLEGARDRELFGLRTIQPMSFLSIVSREGDRVVLDAGSACGLKVGSRWTVYEPGTRSVSDHSIAIGTIEILSVGVTTSEARVVEESHRGRSEGVAPGARAVEGFQCLERACLTVEVAAPAGHSSAALLRERIARSKLLTPAVSGREPDLRVHLLSPRGCARENDAVSELGALKEETWAITGEEGRLLGPAFPRRDPKALEILTENLERLVRLRAVAGLRNPSTELAGLVDFDLLRLEEGSCLPPLEDENGERVFYDGDCVVFEVANRSDKPLYLYFLDLGVTGRIALAYPPLGSHKPLERGQTMRFGARPGEELKLFVPEDFDLLPESSRLAARETVKLLATTSEAELRILFQPGLRFRQGFGAVQSLSDILAATFDGGGYRNLRSAGEDWTTVERSFLLRKRKGS